MRMSLPLQLSLGLLTLVAGLACGGAYHGPSEAAPASTTPSPASTLVYTDPAAGGWRLVRDASSTATHLVLNLVGPSGLKARGVGFNLQGDGSLKFHRFADGNFIKDTGVFQLKLASPNLYETKYTALASGEPVLLIAGTKQNGQLLTAGIYQKDRRQPAQVLTSALCQVGLDLPDAGRPAAGTMIPLRVVRARILPEDLGVMPADSDPAPDWSTVFATFHMVDVDIAVGSLKAN